jgi:hypothetical protein
MQSEVLHAPEGETKLAHVELLRMGRTIRITAVVDNGTTTDEATEEIQGYLAARNRTSARNSPQDH